MQGLIEGLRSALLRHAIRNGFKSPARDVEVFMRCKGLLGPVESLRQVGRAIGLSQEGVRRICVAFDAAGVVSAIGKNKSGAKMLAEIAAAVAVMREAAPAGEQQIEQHLRTKGLIDRPLAIWNAASLFGVASGLRLVTWSGKFAFESESSPSVFRALEVCARKIAAASGAVSVANLVQRFNEQHAATLSHRDAEAMLETSAVYIGDSVEAVGGAPVVSRWFYFPDGRNGVVHKTLAVVRANKAASIRLLFGRCPRGMRYRVAVPTQIIGDVLRARGLTVEGDIVTLDQDARRKIDETEGLPSLPPAMGNMLDVLRTMSSKVKPDSAGRRAVQRKKFIAQCVRRGLNKTTVSLYLSRAGLFGCADGLVWPAVSAP